MTSKDYQAIADVIREVPIEGRGVGGVYISKDLLVQSLCILLKADNPAFSQEKFEKAVNA